MPKLGLMANFRNVCVWRINVLVSLAGPCENKLRRRKTSVEEELVIVGSKLTTVSFCLVVSVESEPPQHLNYWMF